MRAGRQVGRLAAIAAVCWTTPAPAETVSPPVGASAEERSYCPARPGLGTPACTIAPGHVSVETGLVDWQRSDLDDTRIDAFLIGDTQVRIGLTDRLEALIGWTPLGVFRAGARSGGPRRTVTRMGDALIGAKLNLAQPDGSGVSFAVQPFVSLPIGREPVGAGGWEGGIVAPLSVAVGQALSLQFTPEIDSTANSGGPGRHMAYSGVLGLGATLSEAVSATIETQVARDDDPGGGETSALAALSFGWLPRDDLQLDAGATLGINATAPTVQLYIGVSRRF